mmetsp:Transcript_5817/g.18653  ORF Transcript_5817/g.18653 Transcript_5817/m.18653 type:complete len:204 (-) Transcript_5817:913-1524(-)
MRMTSAVRRCKNGSVAIRLLESASLASGTSRPSSLLMSTLTRTRRTRTTPSAGRPTTAVHFVKRSSAVEMALRPLATKTMGIMTTTSSPMMKVRRAKMGCKLCRTSQSWRASSRAKTKRATSRRTRRARRSRSKRLRRRAVSTRPRRVAPTILSTIRSFRNRPRRARRTRRARKTRTMWKTKTMLMRARMCGVSAKKRSSSSC